MAKITWGRANGQILAIIDAVRKAKWLKTDLKLAESTKYARCTVETLIEEAPWVDLYWTVAECDDINQKLIIKNNKQKKIAMVELEIILN